MILLVRCRNHEGCALSGNPLALGCPGRKLAVFLSFVPRVMGIAGCARGWADRSAGFPMGKAATARGGWRDVVMGYDARTGSP